MQVSNFVRLIWFTWYIFIPDDCSFEYMEEQAKNWLDNVYTPTDFKYSINTTQTAWEYSTNINDQTSAAQVMRYQLTYIIINYTTTIN